MHVRSAGPVKILNKLNCDTYAIHFSRDYVINCTFNINDLVDYKGLDCSPLIDKPSTKSFFENSSLSPLSNTHPITTKKVDKILKDEIIITKSGNLYVLDLLERKGTN